MIDLINVDRNSQKVLKLLSEAKFKLWHKYFICVATSS